MLAPASGPSRNDRKEANLFHYTLHSKILETDRASEMVASTVVLKLVVNSRSEHGVEKEVTFSLLSSVVNLSSHSGHLKRCFAS